LHGEVRVRLSRAGLLFCAAASAHLTLLQLIKLK